MCVNSGPNNRLCSQFLSFFCYNLPHLWSVYFLLNTFLVNNFFHRQSVKKKGKRCCLRMAICSEACCYQEVLAACKNSKVFHFKIIFSNIYRNSPMLKHPLVIHVHCQHIYKLIHIVSAVLCVYSLSSFTGRTPERYSQETVPTVPLQSLETLLIHLISLFPTLYLPLSPARSLSSPHACEVV